jgi:hypothetical protein
VKRIFWSWSWLFEDRDRVSEGQDLRIFGLIGPGE